MELEPGQLRAAHQLGEAFLRFMLTIQQQGSAPVSSQPRSRTMTGAVNLDDNRLLRASEAAQLLSLSRGMIYQLMNSGRLPSVQIGGARRFKLSEVKKLMENGAPSD